MDHISSNFPPPSPDESCEPGATSPPLCDFAVEVYNGTHCIAAVPSPSPSPPPPPSSGCSTIATKKECKKEEACMWKNEECQALGCSTFATKKKCKKHEGCRWKDGECE